MMVVAIKDAAPMSLKVCEGNDGLVGVKNCRECGRKQIKDRERKRKRKREETCQNKAVMGWMCSWAMETCKGGERSR